jgi:integrase/recombinase XerD
VTTLIQRMREELVRRNYAATTIQSYLKAVEHFREHVGTALDELGPDDIRSYHAYLLGDRKLAVNTVVVNVCALRFLYIKVLKRRDMKEDLPYPKQRQRLPVILSPGEVAQLIGAARNLYHRTILMTLYSTGLRRGELCRLKVTDIDSKRMMVRVIQGKGGIDREVPLSKKLLAALREYYRWMRPETYLFPGTVNHSRADKPITEKVVWQAVREACTRAGIKKRVSPHTMRHRPRVINVDGNPVVSQGGCELKAEGKPGRCCRCRTCPYLNNIVEQDHREDQTTGQCQPGGPILSRSPADDPRI